MRIKSLPKPPETYSENLATKTIYEKIQIKHLQTGLRVPLRKFRNKGRGVTAQVTRSPGKAYQLNGY